MSSAWMSWRMRTNVRCGRAAPSPVAAPPPVTWSSGGSTVSVTTSAVGIAFRSSEFQLSKVSSLCCLSVVLRLPLLLLRGVAHVAHVEGEHAVVDLVVVAPLERRRVDVVVGAGRGAARPRAAREPVADLVDGARERLLPVEELLLVDRGAHRDEVHRVRGLTAPRVVLAPEGEGVRGARMGVEALEIVLEEVEHRGPDGREGALGARVLLERAHVQEDHVVAAHQEREEHRRDDDLEEGEAAVRVPHFPVVPPAPPSSWSGGTYTAVHAERGWMASSGSVSASDAS